MHKKIMGKAAKELMKDAAHYAKDEKKTYSKTKKKHDAIERKEALAGAKVMKVRAKKAHEY